MLATLIAILSLLAWSAIVLIYFREQITAAIENRFARDQPRPVPTDGDVEPIFVRDPPTTSEGP